MELNKIMIKKIPWLWKYLPFFGTTMASTIYTNIYLIDEDYNDYFSDNPSILVQSIVIHEKYHVEKWKEIGLFKFGFLYFFSKKFRLEQELLAIREQMKFLKQYNEVYDIERKAKHFAGKDYRYLLKIDEARKVLTELWQSI